MVNKEILRRYAFSETTFNDGISLWNSSMPVQLDYDSLTRICRGTMRTPETIRFEFTLNESYDLHRIGCSCSEFIRKKRPGLCIHLVCGLQRFLNGDYLSKPKAALQNQDQHPANHQVKTREPDGISHAEGWKRPAFLNDTVVCTVATDGMLVEGTPFLEQEESHQESVPHGRTAIKATFQAPHAALPGKPREIRTALPPESSIVDSLPMNRAAQRLLELFGQQQTGTSAELEIDDSASGHTIVQLVPILHFHSMYRDSISLSFKIGPIGKEYLLKNIADFLEHEENHQDLVFGKRFTYRPGLTVWEPLSADLHNLILGAASDAVMLFTDLDHMQHYHGVSEPRHLFLSKSRLNQFLDLMEGAHGGTGSPFLLSFQDTEQVVRAHTCPYKINLTLHAIPGGFRLSGSDTLPMYVLTKDFQLLLRNGELIRQDEAAANALHSLQITLRLADKDGIVIPESVAPAFFGTVLPLLKQHSTVTMPESLTEKLVQEPLQIRLYLDRSGDAIVAWPEWQYGTNLLTLANRAQVFRSTDGRVLLRDTAAEELPLQWLKRFGFELQATSLLLSGDDAQCDFMQNGLSRLFLMGVVFATPAFTGMQVRKKAQIQMRLSLGDNQLLTLDVLPEGMTREELLLLFAGCREKKRYVRLKDGSFLDVKETGAAEFLDMMDQLALKKESVLLPQVHLPRYRALFLDRLAKENALPMTRSREVRQMVQEITLPEDLPYRQPDGLLAEMRDYQKTGVSWLATLDRYGFGGILADDMGLGKTLQVLALLLMEKIPGAPQSRPSLVVAPTSLVYNWLAEATRFTPGLRILVVSGHADERALQRQDLEKADLVITSYPLLRRDIEAYQTFRFRYCFADEAQHIKNPASLNAQVLKQVQADSRFALTGTPIENSLTELWSIFDFILPGYLHNHHQFVTKYERPIAKGTDPGMMKRLSQQIAPFLLRRMKKDVLKELPDKIETRITCDMTDSQRKLYAAHLLHAQKEMQGVMDQMGIKKSRIKILALLTRLRQLCCHPATFVENYTGGSGKLDTLLEIVTDAMESGHRILLFSQFTGMLALIRHALVGLDVKTLYLDGQTPSEERMGMVDAFNAGEGQVFLISLKAGGSGLNLTGADMVIHFDPWWNPAVEDQATDRAYRIGQQKAVQVIRLVTSGTIEEKIDLMQQRKRNLTDQIIQPGETFLTQLSETEIQSLFA